MLIVLGNFFFKFRDYLFPVVFAICLLISKPALPGSARLDLFTNLLGLVLALLGQSLRVLTIGLQYIKRGGLNKKVYAESLVTGGVFAHTRNPLYLGNFLILMGLALIANSWAVNWIGIPFFLLAYISIIATEENFLRKKFGPEFDHYCKSVNRVWPDWKGFKNSISDMQFQWKRVIFKDHGSAFAWMSTVLVLRMWILHSSLGAAARNQIYLLSALQALLILAYCGIRIWKRAQP